MVLFCGSIQQREIIVLLSTSQIALFCRCRQFVWRACHGKRRPSLVVISQNRQRARPDYPAIAGRGRRRGDRIAAFYTAVQNVHFLAPLRSGGTSAIWSLSEAKRTIKTRLGNNSDW